MNYPFTIVVPFYNGHEHISRLLSTIPSNISVIIVDDVSKDRLRFTDVPERQSLRILHLNKKGYFSGAVNAGIMACDTNVLILNQDVYFTSTEAFDLVVHEENNAMVGERIKGENPAWKNGYIHGTFMYMNRKAIREVGLLNAKYFPLWGATAEWQLRISRKNYKVKSLTNIPGFVHTRGSEKFGSAITEILRGIDLPDKKKFTRIPPLISVIVPCYNCGAYISDLISSLLGGQTSLGYTSGQTLQAFEIVIVDDCSEDNSFSMLKEVENPSKGIFVYQTKSNGGTSVACNLAIKKSNAEVISRIDSDDMRSETSLELMFDTILANPHSYIYDDVTLFSHGKKNSKIWQMPDKFAFKDILLKNRVHAGIMFEKSAWQEVGGYPELMRYGRDDWAFNVALGSKGYCGVHVGNPGYLYRRETQNRTIRNTTPKWAQVFRGQMEQLFPKFYAGEIDMSSCCGGGQRGRNESRFSSGGGTYTMPKINPNSDMALVQFLGISSGNQSFVGALTGKVYVFSSKKHTRYVYASDLHKVNASGKAIGLLDIMEHGKNLFAKASLTPTEPESTEIEEIIQPAISISQSLSPALEVIAESTLQAADFTVLKGIGKATAQKLYDAGIYYIEDLGNMQVDELAAKIGVTKSTAKKIIYEAEVYDL